MPSVLITRAKPIPGHENGPDAAIARSAVADQCAAARRFNAKILRRFRSPGSVVSKTISLDAPCRSGTVPFLPKPLNAATGLSSATCGPHVVAQVSVRDPASFDQFDLWRLAISRQPTKATVAGR